MPFSCFLFHPRKSCEKHRKCSHTNVSNASVIRFSTPPAQTATFAFTSESGYTLGFRRKIAHKGLHAETGAFRTGGRYHYPRSVLRGSETLRGQVSERRALAILGFGRMYSRRTQKACGTAMRLCASLFRGVTAPLGRVIFLLLSKLRLVRPAFSAFRMYGAGVVSLPSARFACC